MYRIALIDDVRSNTCLLTGYLQALPDLQISSFSDPVTGLAWCREYVPDVILVDYMMPEMDGLDFIRHVREDPLLTDTPVIMITSMNDRKTMHAALQLRATDFLTKPVDPIELIGRTQNMLELRRRYRELKIANERLSRLADTDALTGLRSRRFFMATLEAALSKADKRSDGFCLVLADIDHFKLLNDRFGHDVGDCALKHFARLLFNGLRKTDVVGRVGGEEFAMLIQSQMADAKVTCERLLRSINSEPFRIEKEELIVTGSFGLAEHKANIETLDELFKRADSAMYSAKRNGRNRLEIADLEVQPGVCEQKDDLPLIQTA